MYVIDFFKAVGELQTSIAEQAGVDQSTISSFANKDKIRNLIREEQEKLVKVLPDAVQNVKNLVGEMKDIPKDDTKKGGNYRTRQVRMY